MLRPREYLTQDEIESLLRAAGEGRYGQRDRTLLLLAYRHALRVSEAIALRWDAVDFATATLHVTRLKGGLSGIHPLRGAELRALRQLRREWPVGPYLFQSERGGPMASANVRRVVARCGRDAGIAFPVHPHQLRHACGFKLANDGHDTRAVQHYLGHRNIRHTVRYTELTPGRFDRFWED